MYGCHGGWVSGEGQTKSAGVASDVRAMLPDASITVSHAEKLLKHETELWIASRNNKLHRDLIQF